MQQKKCKKCNIEKEILCFGKDKYTKDGFNTRCKECKRKQNRKFYKNNKKKEQERARLYYQNNKKERAKYRKKYYYGNMELEKRKNKEYREKNKIELSQKSREYRKNNREDINLRERIRRQEDITYRLRKNTSRQIRKMLTQKKQNSIINYLPYTFTELKEHIENQFDEKMNWDNYGTYWHIDHIYPQSKLPYEDLEHPNFQKCWSLTNLRPLEAKENLKKSNKIILPTEGK